MNKYNSNVRTFTARNLLWNGSAAQGAAPAGLHTLNPPNNITIDMSSSDIYEHDFVTQFFDTGDYVYAKEGWDPDSNILIRRAGLFSNFADGLVLENIDGRIGLTIAAGVYSYEPVAGSVTFTAGSNLITGTNFNATFPLGYGFIIAGTRIYSPFYTHNMFAVDVIDDTNARISNYARANYTNATHVTAITVLPGSVTKSFRLPAFPTLNGMYDMELFFDATNVTAGDNVFITATPFIDSPDLDFDLYTVSIDTGFAGLQVTMDAVVEVELTPH